MCRCGGETQVFDSRVDGGTVRRRRKCLSCGERWKTVEMAEEERRSVLNVPPLPIKTGNSILRFLFEEKERQGKSYDFMERRSGLSENTLLAWKNRESNPLLMNVEAALGALGFELVPRRIKSDRRRAATEASSGTVSLPLAERREHGGPGSA